MALIPVVVSALACLWLVVGSPPAPLRATPANAGLQGPSTPMPPEMGRGASGESLVIVVPEEMINGVRALLLAETELHLLLGEVARAVTIVGAPDIVTAQSIADAVRGDEMRFPAVYDDVFVVVPRTPVAAAVVGTGIEILTRDERTPGSNGATDPR